MPTRRRFTTCALTLASAAAFPALHVGATDTELNTTSTKEEFFRKRMREIESAAQGRLGVQMLDTGSGRAYGYRADERFLMLSSFKLLASALVLQRADAGLDTLERRIRYRKEDLVSWSPVTEKHVDEGLSLAQLCEATITTSDNTAANLILASYGGPPAFTAFVRTLGDGVTRLDRIEPALNVAHPTLPLDTTTPRAMLETMHKVVLGNVLTKQSRLLLQQWLRANTTGGKRLKAGLPPGWTIGDKTGTAAPHANDIAVVWPRQGQGAPWLVTAYLAESHASSAERDAALAEVGRVLAQLAA